MACGCVPWVLLGFYSVLHVTNTAWRFSSLDVKLKALGLIFHVAYVCADCIFTDMSGAASMLGVHHDSVANVVNTTFRSMILSVELVDVSYLGIVRFDNVSLSDVTLQQGKIVGTTENDFHYSTEM